MSIWPRKEPLRRLDEQEPRTFRMPPDLEQQLADTMDDYSDEPLAPVRTAKDVADDIAHYKTKLAEGEEWLAKGKAQLAELEAELAAKIGEEKAAHEAECAAKLAELEKLRVAAAGEQP
jgi:paraquat-inducible protein B